MRSTQHATNLFFFMAIVCSTFVVQFGAGPVFAEGRADAAPAHRVLACYFHRTERCPTCKKIGAYIEEAIRAGFARELKQGRVGVLMIDFQDSRNKKYADYYKVSRPTLLILDVRHDKVTASKRAPKVWSLVGKKDEFYRYVQNEVHGYLEGE